MTAELIPLNSTLYFLQVEIEWEDILQDDSCKSIFEMELEDMEDTIDEEDAMVCLFKFYQFTFLFAFSYFSALQNIFSWSRYRLIC